MAQRELVYGPAFQVLDGLTRGDSDALASVRVPAAVASELDQYHLHPALLDACLQSMAGAVPLEPDGSYSAYTYIPTFVHRISVCRRPTEKMWTYVVRTSPGDQPSPETVEADVYLLNEQGQPIATLQRVRIQRLGRAGRRDGKPDLRDWLYRINWQPQSLSAVDPVGEQQRPSAGRHWLVFADQQGAAEALDAELSCLGDDCTIVRHGKQFRAETDLTDASTCEIDPTSPEDFQQVLKAWAPVATGQCGVVFLWSLDLESPDQDGNASFQANRRLGCGSALKLVKQLARTEFVQTPSLHLVTRGAQPTEGQASLAVCQSALWGLGRVAANELPEFRCQLVDLDPDAPAAESARRLAAELAAEPEEKQVALRGSRRYVARLERAPDAIAPTDGETECCRPVGGSFRLGLAKPGSLDSLRYEPLNRPGPGPGQVEINVHAAGLNFSDVLKAMGLYPGITDEVVPLGIECAGVVSAVGEGVERFQVGDKVMGVAPYSFASHAVSAEYALVHKPDAISDEEASTVPITFLTAYYGLIRLAHLQPKERLLVHAGAGGVGLAAIQIAQHVGAEIFATAGSDQKRDYLKSLGVEHVMNSRTLDFADQILKITDRQGVDVVLNSLPGEAITKSLSILSAYGRFLEIGKTDIYQNRLIGLLPFQDNLSYFAIDLDRMLRQRPDYIRELFAEVMRYFREGAYHPLPLKRFTADQSVDAFRYMAQRRNIGKVVVSFSPPTEEDDQHDRKHAAIRDEGTYLVTGGLGALGQRVADWLTDRGAKHVALLSRRPPRAETERSLQALRESGTRVAVLEGDVSDLDSLETALAQIPDAFPPLRGVFHAAGVLADGMLYDMDADQLETPMAPKVQGAWYLHELTKDAPLDFFVLFSSVASVFGSPGQANYAAGNAFLDALAHYRSLRGLPATSINWGPWAESGMAVRGEKDSQVRSQGDREKMGLAPGPLAEKPGEDGLPKVPVPIFSRSSEKMGLAPGPLAEKPGEDDLPRVPVPFFLQARGVNLLPPARALEALDAIVKSSPTNVAVMDVQWGELMGQVASRRNQFLERFEEARETADDSDAADLDVEFCRKLRQADPNDRVPLLRDYVAGEVSLVLGIDRASLDVDQPLNSLGLDSLMGMELKTELETRLGINLPMAGLMEGPTVASLAELAAKTTADGEQRVEAAASEVAAAEDEGTPAATWSPLITLTADGSGAPLFCIHPVGGDARCYVELARQFAKQRPVHALRASGLDRTYVAHRSVAELAEDYVHTLRQTQPEGPYHILGWSTGGIFAYEIARQLVDKGEEIGALVFFDTPLPTIFRDVDLDDHARFLFDLVNFSNRFAGTQMQVRYEELHKLGAEQSLPAVLQEAKRHQVLPADVSVDQLRRLIDVCRDHVHAVMAYQPESFGQRVLMFRPDDTSALAEASGQTLQHDLGWGDVLRDRLTTRTVPGDHFSMMTGDNVVVLARELGSGLDF